MHRLCAVRDGGNDLTQLLGAHVACGIYAGNSGPRAFVCDQITADGIKSTAQEFSHGTATDADEDAVAQHVFRTAIGQKLQRRSDQTTVLAAQKSLGAAVPTETDVFGSHKGA